MTVLKCGDSLRNTVNYGCKTGNLTVTLKRKAPDEVVSVGKVNITFDKKQHGDDDSMMANRRYGKRFKVGHVATVTG